MSDHYVTLVVQRTTEDTVEADAKQLIHFLIENKIVVKMPTEDLKFKPGPDFESIVTEPDLRTLTLSWNEAEILKGRQIFSEAECAEFQLTCNRCHENFDGFKSPTIDVIGAFSEDTGDVFKCSKCGFEENLRLTTTKGFAAGFLGVQFWNWGHLKDDFVSTISKEMNSKITVINGHL